MEKENQMLRGNSSRLKAAVLLLLCGFLAFASARYLTPKLLSMFADSLHIGAPAFLRSISEVTPPERFTAMLVPSHFLVDRSGEVIKKWPGSSNAELVRQRMANQIVSDTVNALSASGSRQSR